MIDLSKIDSSVIIARGQYATVRAEHEEAKKKLSEHCGKLTSIAMQILRRMQPANEAVPESVAELTLAAKTAIDDIERIVNEIESLSAQRHELKKTAWEK